MIRVLLVDDHPVVRAGYLRLLEQTQDIRVVAEGGCADSGYAAYLSSAPDVTITDLSLPGAGGFELMRRVRARSPEAVLLVFSMHEAPLVVRRALESGARGFVAKSAPPPTLAEAVRRVHAGHTYVSSGLSAARLREADEERELICALTPREFEVFRLLAQGTSANACARVLCLSPKTVANYQTLVKEKLGVTTSAALAHLALRHGILQLPPSDTATA